MTRRYITDVARAIPAVSAAPLVDRAKALGERLGNGCGAVEPSDHGRRDRPPALAEDPIRNISKEGKAGDENDDEPQLLRVPGTIGPIMAVGQEGQDRAGDHGVTG